MLIDIAVTDDDPSVLRSLESWIAEDPDLRGVSRHVDGVHASGQDMGLGADLLRLVVEPGGIMVALATVVGSWLAMRPSGSVLRIKKGDTEVEVSNFPTRDAERIATRILDGLRESS